jgi:hypothetical protein
MNSRETYAAAAPHNTHTRIHIVYKYKFSMLMLQLRCKRSYILHLLGWYDFWLPENWSSARPPSTEHNDAPGILVWSYFIKWFVRLPVGAGEERAWRPKRSKIKTTIRSDATGRRSVNIVRWAGAVVYRAIVLFSLVLSSHHSHCLQSCTIKTGT